MASPCRNRPHVTTRNGAARRVNGPVRVRTPLVAGGSIESRPLCLPPCSFCTASVRVYRFFFGDLQVRREVLAAAGPSGYVDCGAASDKRLPMVDACIRESQRMYPVAPFVVRHLASDLRLKDGEENSWQIYCVPCFPAEYNLPSAMVRRGMDLSVRMMRAR